MTKSFDGVIRGYKAKPSAMKKDPTYPIFEAGLQLGASLTVRAILDELERRYLTDEDRPDRFTPEAKALLEVAKSMGELARNFKVEVPDGR